MSEVLNQKKRIGLAAKALALYFAVLPLDFVPIQGIGSITKIIAILPIVCLLFEPRKNISLWLNSTSVWLVIFSAFAVLSLTYTINFDNTLDAVKTLLLNVAMVLVIANLKIYTREEQELIKKALVAGSIFAAVIVLCMAIFGYEGFFETGRMTLAVGKSAQDPNYLCGNLLFGYAYFFNRGLKKRPFVNFMIAFSFVGIVLVTGSRGGFLAFFICTIAIFALLGKEIKKSKILLTSLVCIFIAVLFIAFVLPLINPDVLKRFSLEFIKNSGTTNRFDIWKSLIENFKRADALNQFFGHGYGNCHLLSYNGKYAAHNLYIDNLITLGITGVILQICFQISGLKAAFKNHSYYYAVLLLAMMCMCLSLSLTSYKPLWAVFIMIIIEGNSQKNSEKENSILKKSGPCSPQR